VPCPFGFVFRLPAEPFQTAGRAHPHVRVGVAQQADERGDRARILQLSQRLRRRRACQRSRIAQHFDQRLDHLFFLKLSQRQHCRAANRAFLVLQGE